MKKLTQVDMVVRRLVLNGKKLTAIEAQGLFGITRLAAVIHKMKVLGYKIHTEYKTGCNCTRYATYSVSH